MELTKTDVRNILILLDRVTVKAGEARDFVALCDKLNYKLEQPGQLEQPEQVNGVEDNE